MARVTLRDVHVLGHPINILHMSSVRRVSRSAKLAVATKFRSQYICSPLINGVDTENKVTNNVLRLALQQTGVVT